MSRINARLSISIVLAKLVPAAAGIQGGQTLFFFERCKRHVGELSDNW